MDDIKVALLNDFVHCPICNELFHDPKQLSCLHVLCGKCIMQLSMAGSTSGVATFTGVRSRNISCPICRAETPLSYLKPDFRTKDLVSRYQNYQEPTTDYVCEGCEDNKKEIEWKCMKCSLVLCDNCKNAHTRFPDSSDHPILSVTEAAKLVKEEFSRANDKCTQTSETLTTKLKKTQFYCDHIVHQKMKVLAKIEQDRLNVINNVTTIVNEQAKSLCSVVENACLSEMNHVGISLGGIYNNLKENVDLQNQIQEVLNCEDERKVVYVGQHGLLDNQKEPNEEHDMKEKIIFTLDDKGSSTLYGACANIMKLDARKVDFGEPNVDMSLLVDGRFSKVHLAMQASAAWVPAQSLELRMKVQRMCVIGGNIWLPGGDSHKIVVITPDGKIVAQIQHESLRFPMALAICSNGSIVVACGENKGLVKLDRNTKYSSHIETEGSFHDVSICDNEMAALQSSTGSIIVYKHNTDIGNWDKLYEIKRQHNDPLDSLLLHYGSVFVGGIKCEDAERIVCYQKGVVTKNFNISGDFVRVCIVDEYQSLLISHGRENNLLVLRNNGNTEPLTIQGGVYFPFDVVFTDENTIFVLQKAADGKTALRKYHKAFKN